MAVVTLLAIAVVGLHDLVLYRTWDVICQEFLQHGGYSRSLGRSIGYTSLIRRIVKELLEL